MDIIKIKTESIAHFSYLIIDQNEAAVIDPRRDYEIYIDRAAQQGAKIKYVFETHRNEDFVCGSKGLGDETSAKVYHGAGIDFEFGNTTSEGERFSIGDCYLEILETPGHTPESISLASIVKRPTILPPFLPVTPSSLEMWEERIFSKNS